MDITLLMSTKNRPYLITRALEYYKEWNCNLIICDGSIDPYESPLIENKSFDYFHLPNLSTAKKILYGINKINTKYFCFASDDDFLIQSSIKEGINFLDKNKDFVSVQGQFSSFDIKNEQIFYKNTYTENLNRIIVQNKASERLIYSFNNLMHHFYSVHKVEFVKQAFEVSINLKSLLHIEHNLIIFPLIYGKHMSLNNLWMVRDTARYTDYYKDHNQEDYLYINYNNYINTEEYKYYRSKFIEFYQIHTNCPDGLELFDKLFNTFCVQEKKSILIKFKKIMYKFIFLFLRSKLEKREERKWLTKEFLINSETNWFLVKKEVIKINSIINQFKFTEYRVN